MRGPQAANSGLAAVLVSRPDQKRNFFPPETPSRPRSTLLHISELPLQPPPNRLSESPPPSCTTLPGLPPPHNLCSFLISLPLIASFQLLAWAFLVFSLKYQD